ncbi:MAG: band 7 protein [Verrucomicrobiales bacterium]|jgi:uncharacterized membrane protein YqiK|nr:band 7 protein [Verrucomicrobiales bacterium]MDB6130567.1 band 7 protein [Verrucomicrobiales bacterium]
MFAILNTEVPLLYKVVAVLAVLLVFAPWLLGVVNIRERQVGVVVKKFSGRNLPPGRFVALEGEAGYQAETLAPGLHFGLWGLQYRIFKVPVTVVPQGEIALVVAADGAPIPTDRILGKVVSCDNFQDAKEFLLNGGEKGRQMGFLTGGTYRINTSLFSVITSQAADLHGMFPDNLQITRVEPDRVGIATALDGTPIGQGEIAGPLIPGHDNFQNAQAFINGGGSRGLQEQILLSGSWNLNPWFVQVEQVPMVEIPIGYVGVVISFVGKAHEDVSGLDFKHGDLVNVGHKGVWVVPLYPGKHPINTRIMRVELVPTTNIVLNWAMRTESHNYDSKLSSITVRSKDGFAFNLDVSQIIHVGATDAPKVISRVGSMQNLVDHVLQPIVGNYFRNSAQDFTVLDFLGARSQRQVDAAQHIRKAIGAYDVQAIDTLIGDINPPKELMQTQTDRKIAEEERKTYEVQEAAQIQRQQLVRQTSLANIQQQVVAAEQGVSIAELQANAHIKQATGDAESTRLKAIGESEAIRSIGNAKAEAYRVGVQAIGSEGFTMMQIMQIVGERSVRIVPDVSVTGANGNGGMLDGMLGMLLKKESAPKLVVEPIIKA